MTTKKAFVTSFLVSLGTIVAYALMDLVLFRFSGPSWSRSFFSTCSLIFTGTSAVVNGALTYFALQAHERLKQAEA